MHQCSIQDKNIAHALCFSLFTGAIGQEKHLTKWGNLVQPAHLVMEAPAATTCVIWDLNPTELVGSEHSMCTLSSPLC